MIFRSFLYCRSSIQLLRCTAEAVQRRGRTLFTPAIRWSVGSLVERTDQGTGSRTPDDGSRTSLRTVEPVAWVGPGGRLGVGPELFDFVT